MDFETEAFSDYMDCYVKKYSTWVGEKTFEEVLANEEVPSTKKFIAPIEVIVETIKEFGLANKIIELELDFLTI